MIQVYFRFFGGQLHPVYLKVPDAGLSVQVHHDVGVGLPGGVVVLVGGVEPQTQLDALLPGRGQDGFEAVGEALAVRHPVLGGPGIPEAARGRGRVHGQALLPPVVDLEMGDAQPGSPLQLPQHEPLIHLAILPPVPPGVHHDHFVAPRIVVD